MPTLHPNRVLLELTVVANLVEVFLAKEGRDGLVGVNYLEPTHSSTRRFFRLGQLQIDRFQIFGFFEGCRVIRRVPRGFNFCKAAPGLGRRLADCSE